MKLIKYLKYKYTCYMRNKMIKEIKKNNLNTKK